MNDVDRKIPESLAADEAEPSLWKQVIEMFGGKLRWLNVLVAIGSLACGVFAVVSAVYFFQAEGLREMLAWAAGFGFGLISVTAGRIWF
jgi:hypothetical protein